MCSLGDDRVEETNEKFMPEKLGFISNGKICHKCREQQPQVVLRNKDAYCKTCFLKGTIHKFRALLGKHRFLNADEHVLIIHKGGHPSAALLHFMHQSLELPTSKKMRLQPIVLYIECQFDVPVIERRRILRAISREVKTFNFPLYFISLAEYVLKGRRLTEDFKAIELDDTDRVEFMKAVKQGANLTVQQELLKLFEYQLVIDVAKQLKCKYVFTPELAVDIAAQVLANVSLGRGAHLPLDVSICDSRDPTVKIIRPLRLYEMKELAFYNIFNNVEPVIFENVIKNPYSSVQNLMKEFVRNVQFNYPATVNTIVRTADKLGLDTNTGANNKCLLCQVPVENQCEKITSAESTNFSHWLSTQTPDYNISPVERYTQAVTAFNQSHNNDYCFACSRIAEYIIKP